MKQKVILLGLNEINFDFVQGYINKGYLPAFKQLFEKYGYIETTSEDKYELLEPWIQWVSIHTGKMYDEHRVFRLGDIVENPGLKQLWEIAEEKGLKVGAISPFNARNNLKSPLFFVPDPWTQTTASGPGTLVGMSRAVSATVNNNASNRVGASDLMKLLGGFLAYVPISRYAAYAGKVLVNIKKKSMRAAILDNILADTFLTLWKKHQPAFSSLFLNSGAHVQHHYMFNSKVYNGGLKNPEWYCPSDEDPVLDILQEYDAILARLMKLNCRLFIATGLHQNPHEHNTFYWRLKNHKQFLDMIGMKGVSNVVPRMSRDFLIEFVDQQSANNAETLLQSIVAMDGAQVFTVSNRGTSLFVELIYASNIERGSFITVNGSSLDLYDFVAFVAIKNGEHDGIGYFVDTQNPKPANTRIPLSDVHKRIVSAF